MSHVRSFIGLASYYRKFIRNFAGIAGPLHDLTKVGVDFVWGSEEQTAFTSLKSALAESTLLAFPMRNGGDFILDTDASGFAIGAILSQAQDGPLAFGSRCLSTAEHNYCVTRRELFAVVYFMDYYCHYLLGHTVRVRTVHGCLTWLKSMRYPSGQVARWVECLAPFNWSIEHRPGIIRGFLV